MEHKPIRRREQLPDWLSTHEVAEYLGRSVYVVYELAKQPGCPKLQNGRRGTYLFPRDRFLEWLDTQIATTPPRPTAQDDEASAYYPEYE